MQKTQKHTQMSVLLLFKSDKYHNRNLASAEGEGFEPSDPNGSAPCYKMLIF